MGLTLVGHRLEHFSGLKLREGLTEAKRRESYENQGYDDEEPNYG